MGKKTGPGEQPRKQAGRGATTGDSRPKGGGDGKELAAIRKEMRGLRASLDRAALKLDLCQEEKKTLAAMLGDSFNLSYVHDLEGNFITANDATLGLLGYDRNEIGSINLASLLEDQGMKRAALALVAGGRLDGVAEYRIRTKGGSHVWIETVGYIAPADGEVYAVQGMARDITASKLREMFVGAQRDIAIIFGEMGTLIEALPHVNDVILGFDDIDGGGVYLLNQDTGGLDLVVHRGLGDDFIRDNAHFGPESTRAAYVRSCTGKTYHKGYAELRSLGDPHYIAEGFRSLCSIPVMHEGSPIAVMNYFSRTLEAMPAFIIEGLEAIAFQAGAAIARIRADEAHRASRADYQDLVNNQIAGIYRIRVRSSESWGSPDAPPYVYEFVNDRYCELTGYSKEELYGDPTITLRQVHPEDYGEWAELNEKANRNRETFRWEGRMIVRGEVRRVHFESRPRALPGGDILWTGVLIDITDRRRAEEALTRERDRARQYLDIAGVMIVALDTSGNIILANRKTCEVLGYKEEDLAGRDWFDTAIPERVRDRVRAAFRRIMDGEIDLLGYGENVVMRRNGEERLIAWHNTVLRDGEGGIEATLSSGEDITYRRRVEDALAKSEQLFRALIEHSYEGITMIAADGTILYDSPPISRILGYGPDERVGKNVAEYVHPDEREGMREGFAAYANKTGDIMHYEGRFIHRDGSLRWIEGVRNNLLDNPLVEAIVVNYRDITDRKMAEMTLRESEEKYRTLFDEAAEGIALMALDNSTLMVNKSFARMHGYESPEEMSRVQLNELDTPETARLAPERLRRIREGEALNFDVEHYHRDGHIITMNVSCKMIHAEGKDYYMGLHQDITERRRAEEALRASEELNRIISAMTTDYVFMVRMGAGGSLELAWVSENFSRLTRGRSVADVKTQDLWMDIIHPDDRELFSGFMEKTIREMDEGYLECRSILPDGTCRHIQIFVKPIMPEGGALTIYGAVNDITDRKMAEGRIVSSLREKEILLQEVHHRVKNNLQSVISLFGINEDRIRDPGDLEVFREMRGKIYSMALIHEMLYRSGDLSALDMGDYVRELAAEVYRAYGADPARIVMRVDIQGISLGIRDAVPCGLLIHELVVNSLKHAYPEGRKGLIAITMKKTTGGAVELVVSDDGVGLPDGIGPGGGGSMGLTLVRGWVRQMGATLDIERRGGTRYVIRMGVADIG
ncbi:MAG: PAS domain S-box protein [Spirochaetes bacterium]|nr:PAS domain S-box protein [Spirochaetota bacterium]